jgi:hypothetical protein
MATILQLRTLADRCFADADTMSDSSAQDRVRSRAYHYLQQAASLERREAQQLLGDGRCDPSTPLQHVALVQLARVQEQINAIEADRPPERSARANIASVLYRKKAQLEQVLAGGAPSVPQRSRRARRRPVPHSV